ncbi:MAG TPA: hypothetical protein VKV35_05690 [Streptosporangiaceae bacterium]|nr:hypothetical protein [Streptosporangiaceae bacterium]
MGVTVTVAVGVAVRVTVAGELAGAVAPALEAGVTEPLATGDSGVGDPEGVDDEVQPETAARPASAAAPQPAAASRARSAVPGENRTHPYQVPAWRAANLGRPGGRHRSRNRWRRAGG